MVIAKSLLQVELQFGGMAKCGCHLDSYHYITINS